MTYSPRGAWIAKTSAIGIALATVVLLRWLHPGKSIAFILMVVVVLFVIASLGVREFFYRDEIERQNRMHCWYFGSRLGAVIAGLVTIAIFFFFALPFQNAMINFFSYINTAFIHQPVPYFRAGFASGFLILAITQAVSALLIRAFRALPTHSGS